jgi:peptidoglycan hydrolase-like protein with peptidoglycan-binding domain
MRAPHHPVKVRPGARPAAVPASLLTLAAPLSAATATVKNPPSHPARRPAAAGPTPRSSPARHPLARTRLRAVRLQVARSGYDTPRGSAAARALHRVLAGSGWAPGPIDGRSGPPTAQALKRFQPGHCPRAAGITGPHTRRAVAVMPRGAAGQAPRERRTPRRRPAPNDRPPPQPSGAQRRPPGLPAARVLLAPAALRRLTGTLGYARARHALANQPQPRAQRTCGLARVAWHPRNGVPVASSNTEGER